MMTSPTTSAATATATIAVTGLRKSYGERLVLDGIDLTVQQGTVFALLGPNGAGKTTTVQILSTLIHADGGEATLAGYDLNREAARVREVIGVTGQYSAVDKLLTGRENLMLMADLYHLGRARAKARAAELLERFDLTEAAGKLVATYSGGMQRKLDLAMTLVSSPQIIFLDEPTTGLDPRSRRTMWQIVKDLTRSGVAIFLTTQYLEEADQLASHIALLDHGTLIAQGTPEELKRMIPGGHIRLRFTDPGTLSRARDVIARPRRADEEALTLEIPTSDSVPELRGILARLDDHHIDVAELTVHTPDLDDVFLTLTGN
jgi:ABC-2 type transport system ATP-binding protein